MKNLILIIAAVFTTGSILSQGNVFNDYYEGHTGSKYMKKGKYVSNVDGKLTFHLWGHYDNNDLSIIIEAANDIFEAYNMKDRVTDSMFLKNGETFETAPGELIKEYSLPDGGTLFIGYDDDYVDIGGGTTVRVKSFDMWVKYPKK